MSQIKAILQGWYVIYSLAAGIALPSFCIFLALRGL